MRTPAGTSVRTILVIASSLLLLALGAGCNPKENAELSKAFRSLPLAEAAGQVAAEYGTVIAVHEGSAPVVVVFEEEHSSILQQTQIAIMLNRLYERFGLRTIGLEGASIGYFSVPKAMRGDHRAGTVIGDREGSAVQMLAAGEISAPELLAVVYPDVLLEPVEDASLYAEQEARQEDYTDPTYYLALIALSFMPQEEQARILTMSPEEGARALLDGIDANPTAKGLRETYSNSCCCDTSSLDPIAALAVERQVASRQEIDASFKVVRDFVAIACKRGHSMADRMISAVTPKASKRGEAVVAIVCGAAHCEIAQDLAGKGRSYVVIRPAAFDSADDPTRLSPEDLHRKYEQLPVVHSDALRKALAGEQVKYESVLGTLWARAQIDVRMLTSRIAHEAAAGRVPPLTEAALADLPLTCSHVVQDSLYVDRGEVVFAIGTLDENGKPATVWVRATVDRERAEQTLDQRLRELDEELSTGVEQARETTVTPGVTAIAVSADVKAAFCSSAEVAAAVRVRN